MAMSLVSTRSSSNNTISGSIVAAKTVITATTIAATETVTPTSAETLVKTKQQQKQ
jgi:hypothetical protein